MLFEQIEGRQCFSERKRASKVAMLSHLLRLLSYLITFYDNYQNDFFGVYYQRAFTGKPRYVFIFVAINFFLQGTIFTSEKMFGEYIQILLSAKKIESIP